MRQTLMRYLKLFLLILLGYLVQVSVMPYFKVGDVTPSLLIAVTSIITVGFGMLHGLWTGMIYGIVMEIMLPTIPMMNLLFYPVSAVLCSLFFADKSASRLQYERSAGKRGRNISPRIRTVACAAMNVFFYELINLVYMYLSGADITAALVWRGFTDLLATAALTALIMLPVRRMLGFRKKEEAPVATMRFDHRPARD